MTPSFAQKPTNGGTPARLNMSIAIMPANQGLRAFRALEILQPSASKPCARQQQDHAEGSARDDHVADRVEQRRLVALRRARQISRAA